MHQEKNNHLTAGTSLAWSMLTLIGACSTEQQRAKLCATHCLSQGPWVQSTPGATKSLGEALLHLKTCSFFFPFQNPVFSCQPKLPCLLTPLTHLCFHKHSRLQSGRNLDSFPHCPTQNLMDPSSHLNFQTELFINI